MNKVDNYGTYQSGFYNNMIQGKREQEAARTAEREKNSQVKADKANKAPQAELSSRAQKLLEKLKKKYGNMDFMVADYEDDEEAAAYLSRGTKEFSVLIEPELLEKMPADEKTEQKYTGIIEDSADQLSEMKGELGKDLDNVKTLGMTVKEDGTTTFFADLEKMSEQQRERIEKSRDEKKEKKAEESEAGTAQAKSPYQGKSKSVRVYADSVSELVDRIKNVDWDRLSAEEEKESGRRFDFSI